MDEEALIAFDKTIQLDPKHIKAYFNKGLLLIRWAVRRGKYSRKGKELDPNVPVPK
jgi:hypothetical protein